MLRRTCPSTSNAGGG